MTTFRQVFGVLFFWGGLWGILWGFQYAMASHSVKDINVTGAQLWIIEAQWYWRVLTGVYYNTGQLIMPTAVFQIMTLPMLVIDLVISSFSEETAASKLRLFLFLVYVLSSSVIGSAIKKHRSTDVS